MLFESVRFNATIQFGLLILMLDFNMQIEHRSANLEEQRVYGDEMGHALTQYSTPNSMPKGDAFLW